MISCAEFNSIALSFFFLNSVFTFNLHATHYNPKLKSELSHVLCVRTPEVNLRFI